MELPIRPARFSGQRSATRAPSIHMDEARTGEACGRLTSGEQVSPSLGVGRQGPEEGGPALAAGCYLRRVPLCWRLARSVQHVDRSGWHACALELLPVDRTMFAHYTSRMLTTIRLHPTRLKTRTKESNICASLGVIEACGLNESKGHPRWLK